MKTTRSAIAATFSNRGTELRLIQIESSMIDTTQKYWSLYLKALPEEVRKDLPVDFRKVVDEINQNSIHFNLVPAK